MMERALELLHMIGVGLFDAYVVVDREQRVVDFNRLFFSLFPEPTGRALKGTSLDALLRVELAGRPLDLPDEVFERHAPVRYDAVTLRRVDADSSDGLIAVACRVSATPVVDLAGSATREPLGVLLLLRTDDARSRLELEERLERRGRELLEARDALNNLSRELIELRKRMLV